MVTNPANARRFIKVYQAFLLSIAIPEECHGKTGMQILAMSRGRYAKNRSLFTTWRARNSERDADVLEAIAHIEIGRWVYLKDTRSYSVFLREDGQAAYAVQGLTDRLRDIHGYSGITVRAGVFQLGGQFVCDGILEGVMTLGANYMANFRDEYQSLRANGHFYATPADLPCGEKP